MIINTAKIMLTYDVCLYIGGYNMNRSRKCDVFNKEEKGNFVLLHNNNEYEEKTKVTGNSDKYIQANEIIEYTDDVAEQMRILYTKIPANLEEYYKGKSDLKDINERLRQYYFSIKNYCINTGLIKENNNAYKNKLLRDIYRSYRHNAVIIAMDMNELEGKELQKEFSKENLRQTYFYYNSNYFYWCKMVRETLIEIVKNLAHEEEIKDFETESIDRRKRYIYDYEFNYSWFLKNKVNIKLKDNDLIPPKDIKFFYHKTVDEITDGKLLVFYKSKVAEYTMNKTDFEQDNILNLFMESNYPFTNESHLEKFFQSFLSQI